jgi:hypothetical protein
MPAPLTETIGNASKAERPNYNLRRLAALAGVLAVGFGVKAGINEGKDIAHHNMLVNQLERPIDAVQADVMNGKFKPGEVTTVTVTNPPSVPSAFAEAQALARDDIDVGDLPAIISAQEMGDSVAAGDKLVIPTDMLDPNAVLPADPNTHVQ